MGTLDTFSLVVWKTYPFNNIHIVIYHYIFYVLLLSHWSPSVWLTPIIVCYQPRWPLANSTTDWNGVTPPPLPSSVSTTDAVQSKNQVSEWTPFLSRHKADSKANSHCLKWHCCPGICLTFCLMHKTESMHNPCLINIFPHFHIFPHLSPLLPEK